MTGFGDGTGPGDVHPLPGAVEEAEAFLTDHPETRERYDRIIKLIDGFEAPYGLELLASTHRVATNEGPTRPRPPLGMSALGVTASSTCSPPSTSRSPGSTSTRAAG